MPRTPSEVYNQVLQCDRKAKTLKGAGFEHMAQVAREERSRLVHELQRQADLGGRSAMLMLLKLKTNRA